MSEAPIHLNSDANSTQPTSNGVSNDSRSGNDAVGASALPAASAPAAQNSSLEGNALAPTQLFVPSLRGKIIREGNSVICRGKWAMTDAQHGNEDLTSDFEFKLVTPTDAAQIASGSLAVGGIYQGWFKLKKNLPLKGYDKVEDKAINISLEPKMAGETIGNSSFNADADMRVSGKGKISLVTLHSGAHSIVALGIYSCTGSTLPSRSKYVLRPRGKWKRNPMCVLSLVKVLEGCVKPPR